jgi:hypothetical protein
MTFSSDQVQFRWSLRIRHNEVRIDAGRRHLLSSLLTIGEILPPAAVEREAQVLRKEHAGVDFARRRPGI